LTITIGGTSAAYDHSVAQSIFLNKTLSVAGSWTTQWVLMPRLTDVFLPGPGPLVPIVVRNTAPGVPRSSSPSGFSPPLA
jgi:hypothetical protein